jgi:hypothetical protein
MDRAKERKLLDEIKWLLVLQLDRNGVARKDIARLLQIDPAVLSRRLPPKTSK